MLHVYWTELDMLDTSYEQKRKNVHKSREEKMKSYKMQEDRIRCLGAGLLLERGLEDYLNICLPNAEGRCILEYVYGRKGKPYLKDYPEVYFNLSHSGNVVVLAMSDKEVGIDIQEQRKVEKKVAGRFFHEKETALLNEIKTTDEWLQLFYHIWTGKEAYIKYTGAGMSQDLQDFIVDVKNNRILCGEECMASYEIIELGLKNYFCGLVFDKKLQEIDKIVKISF